MVRPAILCSLFSIVILIGLTSLIVSIVIPLNIKKDIKKYHDKDQNEIPEPIPIPEPSPIPEPTPIPEPSPVPEPSPDTSQENVEVWLIDQSDTFSSQGDGQLDSGGTIHVYKNTIHESKIDLGQFAEWIFEETGAYPKRPHYVEFNTCKTHAIVSFVLSGHVLIMDIKTHQPVYVVKVGQQAHTAIPSYTSKYLLVTDQNGKKLHRINTDYQNLDFEFDEAASIDLDNVLTNDELFTDNAPILAVPSENNKFGFVTLRGGGFLVIDALSTPMIIKEEFGNNYIEANGLFTLEHGNKVYINSGGGSGDASGIVGPGYQNALYVYDQSTQDPPELLFKKGGETDGHGMAIIGDYLWIADISDDNIIVVDTKTNNIRNNIALPSHSAPDLLTHANGYVYVSYKGPIPLTGNNPDLDNAKGKIPGMGVIKVKENGASGKYIKTERISHEINNIEHADAHGIGSFVDDIETMWRRYC